MEKPVRFSVSEGADWWNVEEDGWAGVGLGGAPGVVFRVYGKTDAEASAKFANLENRGGRKPHGECGDHVPCDRDRIHDPEGFLRFGNGRKVVLCPRHHAELASLATARGLDAGNLRAAA